MFQKLFSLKSSTLACEGGVPFKFFFNFSAFLISLFALHILALLLFFWFLRNEQDVEGNSARLPALVITFLCVNEKLPCSVVVLFILQ